MGKNRRLEEKVAIITGAANGIGRATAVLFGREGAKTTLADINVKGLEETLNLVKHEGGEATIRKTDVAVENEVKELIDLTLKTYSQVDILCNNAGIAGELVDPENQDADEWRRAFEV